MTVAILTNTPYSTNSLFSEFVSELSEAIFGVVRDDLQGISGVILEAIWRKMLRI